MSLLQVILNSFPGTGHYAFAEIAVDAANNSIVPFDTATVVGSSISVTTSGGNIGRFTVNANGTYLFLGVAGGQFSLATDDRFVIWAMSAGGTGAIGSLIGASNAAQGVRSTQGGLNWHLQTMTSGQFGRLSIGSGSAFSSLRAGYSWAFVARLA